jgi:predicted N-acetyltransferase YhbS
VKEQFVRGPEGSRLPAGFLLRAVETDSDVDRFVGINCAVTGEGEIARRLITYRPSSRRDDFVMVVEKDTDRVVSSTCLLRWAVSFEGIPLSAAMLEMVVTDPDYRHHGLVRGQVDVFHERASQLGSDMCIIQGIPFYYRQFGYGYALDHAAVIELEARLIPDVSQVSALLARTAVASDAAALSELYASEMSSQGLHVQRTAADWDYLLTRSGRRFEIIERRGAGPLGYLLTSPAANDLMIDESGLKDHGDAPMVLALLMPRCKGSLLICGNAAHSLSRAALALGGKTRIPAQWLVRIVDPATLLARVGSVLESRLAQAGFSGIDAEILVNFYKSALRMRITRGKIAAVERAGFVDASMGADGGDLCIPPDAFTRLVFGYRDLDQVRDAWPDTAIRAASRPLLDALFPRMDSLILMPY